MTRLKVTAGLLVTAVLAGGGLAARTNVWAQSAGPPVDQRVNDDSKQDGEGFPPATSTNKSPALVEADDKLSLEGGLSYSVRPRSAKEEREAEDYWAILGVPPQPQPLLSLSNGPGNRVWMRGALSMAAQPTTDLLSIYLVAAKIEKTIYAPQPPTTADLKLVMPAAISGTDFVAFDTTNCSFTITADAGMRLAERVWKLSVGEASYAARGTTFELVPAPVPYVLVASGERICSGMFWTLYSSLPPQFPGPIILPDEAILRTDQKGNVSFSIRKEGSAADPCRDGRLLAAVEKLFTKNNRASTSPHF